MINVMHIISDTNIGGAGSSLLNLLRHYDRESYAVSVALPRGSLLAPRIGELSVPVHELDCLRDKSLDIRAIGPLKSLIRSQNPDLVHTHGALSGRIAAKRCKKPVVFTRHSAFPPNPRFTKGLGKAAFKLINERYADRIIAVSEVCRDDLLRCGVSASRVDVVLNGVPPVPATSTAGRDELRRGYGIAPDDFAAGIIARVEPYKGHIYAVEAMRILLDEGKRAKLIVAGAGTYEDEVKKHAEELSLGDNIVFTGFVSDVAPLYGALDVQINASYVEATSLSLLEGMSAGLPAVASDSGGNPFVIEDGVNGLIFKSQDSEALARRLSELMDSPVLMGALSGGARKVFEDRFTCENFARNVETTYKKTLEDFQSGK